MSGNVMEWVHDYYDRNYFETSPIENPRGPSSGSSRVNKGGNWFASPEDARCAFRGFSGQTMSFWNLGFRVVMEDDEKSRAGSVEAKLDSSSGTLPPGDEDGIRLFREAMLSAQQQQWDQAIQVLEEALKVYETRKDLKWMARVRATLAGIYAERNRTYKSKELYTQALSEFRTIGDGASARIILARLQELETSPGVKVVEVKKGGLADKAGIVVGDVIIEYGGETGFRVVGFKKLVDEYTNTDQITISTMNNNEITTTLVPGGILGVALEDIKKAPRPARRDDGQRDRQQRQRQRQNRR